MQVSLASHYDPVSFEVCGKSFMYIRKTSSLKIDSCGTTQFISPTSEKISSNATKIFCLRDMTESI